MLGWWIVAIISLFYFFAKFAKISIIFSELKLSNPEVGSSNIRHDGFDINSTPIATLFFCPPEIDLEYLPPIYAFWTYSKFS